RYGPHPLTCATSHAGQEKICTVYPTMAYAYWPTALRGAYVAISSFYIRRSRRRGVGTPIRPYAVAGVVLALVLTAASLRADHPVNGIYDLVHQRVRLGILTITHQARQVEFGFLRSTLELTAGNLSQHLNVLENAGLISIDKGYHGKRPRTWVHLTKAGSKAL